SSPPWGTGGPGPPRPAHPTPRRPPAPPAIPRERPRWPRTLQPAPGPGLIGPSMGNRRPRTSSPGSPDAAATSSSSGDPEGTATVATNAPTSSRARSDRALHGEPAAPDLLARLTRRRGDLQLLRRSRGNGHGGHERSNQLPGPV